MYGPWRRRFDRRLVDTSGPVRAEADIENGESGHEEREALDDIRTGKLVVRSGITKVGEST